MWAMKMKYDNLHTPVCERGIGVFPSPPLHISEVPASLRKTGQASLEQCYVSVALPGEGKLDAGKPNLCIHSGREQRFPVVHRVSHRVPDLARLRELGNYSSD